MDYQLKELSIEVTNKCFLKCIHCSSGSTPGAYPDELKPSEIVRLIKEARELGATVLSLSGGDPITLVGKGRIMCIGSIYDYIHRACELGYERVLYYTTGVSSIRTGPYVGFADPTICDVTLTGMPSVLLKDVKEIPSAIDKVKFVFSLHSHRPEVNDYIMGMQGAWRVILDNITRVRSYGFRAWIHMVPMLPNWKDIQGLLGLCEDIGVSKMSLLRFVPQTRGMDNNKRLLMDVKDFAEMQRVMDHIDTDGWGDLSLGTRVRLGCPIDFRHTVIDDLCEKSHPCHAGKDLILVRPRGDVHPCAAWKTLPETDNVRDNSLKYIWNKGVVFAALRGYHEGGWKSIKGACASCKYQESCRSGCPAQRMHALKLRGLRFKSSIDDLYVDAPDPLCPVGRF